MSTTTSRKKSAPPQRSYRPAFQNTYAQLPERFFARPESNPVAAPRLIRINPSLADELELDRDWLTGREGLDMLAGNRFPDSADPIALAYAGHQFGSFVPQLGDGRALLVGELVGKDGNRRDIQLKGSGPTRYSRNGDGRAALGPVLREYVVSEAMAALGIPTTRSLAAVLTGELVYRQQPLPGAILTRVAASHIRIGTFQYFAARGDLEALRLLADYAIRRHFPELQSSEKPYLALLEAVTLAQARLVARWMLVGFIHGVMNTDNMAISGETIDYGPCAFMDAYSPGAVFSSIDRAGRYAYANQPGISVWNLTRLAETLLPLLSDKDDEAIALAEAALRKFQEAYEVAFHGGLRKKLGLFTEDAGDLALASDLFEVMARNGADFTLTFRSLSEDLEGGDKPGVTRSLFAQPSEFDVWVARWRQRLAREPEHDADRLRIMRSVNPKYIPRNHRVEAVIQAAVESADFEPFEALLDVVSKPYDEQPARAHYADPPAPHERILETFCGT